MKAKVKKLPNGKVKMIICAIPNEKKSLKK